MKEKKSMSLEDLSMYLEDLKKMGFVSEYLKDGKKYFQLTEMGKKSGLNNRVKIWRSSLSRPYLIKLDSYFIDQDDIVECEKSKSVYMLTKMNLK